MTAENSAQTQPQPLASPMGFHCLNKITGAGWIKTAMGSKQGTYKALVKMCERGENFNHELFSD